MGDEIDAGIDKQKILAEIGASAPLPGGTAAAPPSPLPPPAPAASPAVPPPSPPEAPPGGRKSRWTRYRRQIAALVMVFVALLWIGVGLATFERAPVAIGGGFLVLAVLVWVGSLLREG